MHNNFTNQRRDFFKQSATAVAATALGVVVPKKVRAISKSPQVSSMQKTGKVTVSGGVITVDSLTLIAVLEHGMLRSLKSKITGEEYAEFIAIVVHGFLYKHRTHFITIPEVN